MIDKEKLDKIKPHLIQDVESDSIAWELEIASGDKLVSVNGEVPRDIFDYQFMIHEEELLLVVEKADGELWELEIEKDYQEDLGLVFEQSLMDDYQSCRNNCVFCFIDQMPPGMRETLYFKDDDARLSFLQGNYITLTNMSDDDVRRIVKYHLEPINVSVHTMNPELRCEMLHNRFAGEALKKIDILYEGGIQMNGQIVLCPGINDGEELERSIRELRKYLPHMQSVSVVPVGLTKFREGLADLRSFTKEEAKKVLETIHRWQDEIYQEQGTHFIHAGDEWYLLADEPIPEEESYDGYLQLENGVGMIRLLKNEVKDALEDCAYDDRTGKISLVTGELFGDVLAQIVDDIGLKFPNIEMNIHKIHNDFFGEKITVSGLVTGGDIIRQLEGKDLGQVVLIPENMLRSGEEVFLDDITLEELKEALQVEVDIVKSSGYDLISRIGEKR